MDTAAESRRQRRRPAGGEQAPCELAVRGAFDATGYTSRQRTGSASSPRKCQPRSGVSRSASEHQRQRCQAETANTSVGKRARSRMGRGAAPKAAHFVARCTPKTAPGAHKSTRERQGKHTHFRPTPPKEGETTGAPQQQQNEYRNTVGRRFKRHT